MKKFTSIITLMLIAAMAFTFTSCEDEYIADNLSGGTFYGKTWQGTIRQYYHDRWGLSGNHYRTVMQFNGEGYTSGTGYEVDYDLDDPYGSYYYCEFDWNVYGGTITIRYADTYYDPVYIYDYSLSSNYFEGYFDDGTASDISFRLYAINNFDWDPYWYDYDYYDDYYYAKPQTRAAGDSKLKTAAKGAFAK